MSTPNDSNPPEGKKIDGEKIPEERISFTLKTLYATIVGLVLAVGTVAKFYYDEHTEIMVMKTNIENMDKSLDKAIETRSANTRADYRVLIESKDYSCDDLYWDIDHFKKVVLKKNCNFGY